MNTFSNQIARPRINGTLLSQHQGRNVCLLGYVMQSDPSGMAFKLKTSDNQIVPVQMKQPIQDCMEGLVEIQGMVTPHNSVICHEYIIFPKETAVNFDMKLYNEAVLLMARYPNYYVAS